MATFDKLIHRFSNWCNWVACIAVLLLMGVVCGNVVLRFFDLPILGTFEYVTLLSSIAISFGLAYTAIIGGHVAVDLVMRRFSQRVQMIVDSITGIVALGVFAVIIWWIAVYAYNNYKIGLVTETMEIPLYPFMYGISFGFLIFSLVLLTEVIRSVMKAVKA